MWQEGDWAGYKWEAKVYDEKSNMGIYGGRASKLTIYNPEGEMIVNYDRGWDVPPQTTQINSLVFAILDELGNLL